MAQKDNCIFCRIIKGEMPAVIFYEDEKCIGIMDKYPATKGQSLIIPKKHYSYILDMEEGHYLHLFSVAKRVAKSIDKAFHTERTCFVVEGFAVPHVHIRLHPCYEKKLELHGSEADNQRLEIEAKEIKKYLI